jgi:hypothetical protein
LDQLLSHLLFRLAFLLGDAEEVQVFFLYAAEVLLLFEVELTAEKFL